MAATNNTTPSTTSSIVNSNSIEHKDVMYKTSMCRTFGTTGSCPYGYKCLFAHGTDELRSVTENENLQSQGASPRQVPNYRSSVYRSLAPAWNSSHTRAQSLMSGQQLPLSSNNRISQQLQQQSQQQQRHSSVINQSLVAQSARRSRAFFPSQLGSPKNPLLSPMWNRNSLFVQQSQGSYASSPTNGPSLSRRSMTPSQSMANVAAPSPRKWTSSNVDLACSVTSPMSSNDSNLVASPKTPQALERAKKLYKTELCRSWQESKMCPYGVKCQFAHGEAELRQVERHRKYKTEPCKKFHSEGVCPFGSRCIFIHDEDERELPNSPLYDPVYAEQMRQRRSSVGPVRHLSPSVGSSLAFMAPAGVNAASRSNSAAVPNMNVASPSARSPYNKRFSRFGDQQSSVDDFIKRRMTDTEKESNSKSRIGQMGNGLAALSLKESSAKAMESPDNSSTKDSVVQKASITATTA